MAKPSPSIPAAYTPEQASRLTGISRDQLRRWAADGFYAPELERANLYSFRDLVALGTLNELRNTRRIPLHRLRAFGEWLRERALVDNPWASLRFRTDGKEFVVEDPDGSRCWVSGSPLGQLSGIVELPFADVVRRIRTAAVELTRRPESKLGKLETRRGVAGSQRVVAGTRIPTAAIWEFHSAGYSTDQILAEYPSLKPEDVEAAIEEERKRHEAA